MYPASPLVGLAYGDDARKDPLCMVGDDALGPRGANGGAVSAVVSEPVRDGDRGDCGDRSDRGDLNFGVICEVVLGESPSAEGALCTFRPDRDLLSAVGSVTE